jgi:hypothetical protein
VIEVRHFAAGGGAANRLALGFGTVALLVTASALGYVFLLAARRRAELEGLQGSGGAAGPAVSTAAEFWTGCIRLGIGNLLVTGPLFLIEIGGAAVLAWIDPPLLLLGLPLLALQLMRVTANFGLRLASRTAG